MNNLNEWVPLIGYEDRYSIFYDGKSAIIKSKEIKCKYLNGLRTHKAKIITQSVIKIGYTVVYLKNGNRSSTTYLHRIIGQHFIPNPKNYPCINHINGDKLNNSIENIEWCSFQDNCQHAFSTGLRKRRITFKDAENIRLLYKNGEKRSKLIQKYGITDGIIQGILTNASYKRYKTD